MSVGNVFGKRHLFQKREAIDAERFCQIHYDFKEKKPFLGRSDNIDKDVELMAQIYISVLDREIYAVNTLDFIPPRCKIGDPFEVFYDKKTQKLYAVPQDCGVFRFMLDGKPVEINGSDLVPIKRETLIGRISLECAEYFRDNEFI